MAQNTRDSVLAIKEESTEGTPVSPSAGSDYVTLQSGFSVEPSFNELSNDELRSSIGMAKNILGTEQPTASFSHYLRHGGTEGTAPDFGPVLKAAFGNENTLGSELDTVAGSTSTTVELDTNEGSNYSRGNAVLVKDNSNGYSIRPVHSVSGDSLNLGFELANAPASSVNLGKYVTYSPANDNHTPLSLWFYRGDGGAVELVSGARPTSVDIEFPAGEFINQSYSFEGIEYFFDPLEVTSSNDHLDFTDSSTTTFNVTVAQKVYKDPKELAQALQDAMNNTSTGDSYTVTYIDIGTDSAKFKFEEDGNNNFELNWNTGTNAANTVGTLIGFDTSSDDTGNSSYTSDNAIDYSSPQTPSYDSNVDPLVAKNNELYIGDQADNVCISASNVSFSLSTTRSVISDICATTGQSGSIYSEREATAEVTALLETGDADKFNRFRKNTDTRMMYAFGEKSASDWVAGKSGCLYFPNATISSFSLGDEGGLVTMSMTVKAYVDSAGKGEVYLNFL